jgi:hypothetical protein
MSEYPGAVELTEDPAQAERAERIRRDQEAALDYVLSEPNGRAFVWGLLEKCGVFGASFMGEHTHATAFNEGRRDIGIRVLAEMLQHRPEALAEMQCENQSRQERYHVIPRTEEQ